MKNGLHNVKIVRVKEYNKDRFDKESALDHYLVPYLYSEDADTVAENFLNKHCKRALKTAMPLPVEEIVRDLGMQLFFAPLDDNIFGKTYFETSTVTDLQIKVKPQFSEFTNNSQDKKWHDKKAASNLKKEAA